MLTRREQDVHRYMKMGWTNRQIASKLGISSQTTKNHVTHIYQKLHIKRRGMVVVHDNAIDLDALQRQEADAHSELVRLVQDYPSARTTFAQVFDQLLEVGRLNELMDRDGEPVKDVVVLSITDLIRSTLLNILPSDVVARNITAEGSK